MSPLQQCRIRATLHAVDAKEGRGFVTIPEGATVIVVGDPDGRHLVPVRWEDRQLFVFEQDLTRAAQQERW
jgi:hypothetical protein